MSCIQPRRLETKEDRTPPYCVRLIGQTVVGWLGLILSACLAISAFSKAHYGMAIALSCFSLCAAVALLTAGRLVFDDNGALHQCMLGKYFMRWDDIQGVEVGNGAIIIKSERSQLVIMLYGGWSGRDRFRAFSFMRMTLPAANVSRADSKSFSLEWHKNARVRR
jgi:hypothetical protein